MIRSAITAACAVVNDSIAPNEYRFPRNVVLPGISSTPAITEKNTIVNHGVR